MFYTKNALKRYGHEVGDCSGNAVSQQVTVNGTCSRMSCLGFNDMQYDTSDCSGTPYQNRTNEYIYWAPDVCEYNATQTCVGGQPQTSFYNNSGYKYKYSKLMCEDINIYFLICMKYYRMYWDSGGCGHCRKMCAKWS
jgi:hypothetical protein